MATTLTWDDIVAAADMLGLEPCLVDAVYTVESAGSGFYSNGQPKILFEGHVFWKELKKRGINPEPLAKKYPNIVYPKWTKQYYTKGANEYSRLELAKSIDEEAALCSASWGLFQIMGFNYGACGYDNVFDFVEVQYESAGAQLESFCVFMRSQGLIKHLKNKNWAAFARAYNGPAFAQNQYDTKLAQAYTKCLRR